MLDASVALMNQYTLVAARLPPMPIPTTVTPIPPTQPTTSTAETTTIPQIPTASEPPVVTTTESVQQPDSTSPKFQIEDLGSDEDDLIPKKEPIPSTSKEFIIHESVNASPQLSEAPASKSNSSTDTNESSEMSEIRRRRLERFGGNQSD